MMSNAEKNFVSWLVTQPNTKGTLFLPSVAQRYARSLRTVPQKLALSLPIEDRNVFVCEKVMEFDCLRKIFMCAPNYREVNFNTNHGEFSAGLAAYRKYLESLAGQNGNKKLDRKEKTFVEQDMAMINPTQSNNIFYVDFNHTELCKNCNPVTCLVAGEKIAVGTWRDLIVTLAEKYLAENNAKMLELYALPLFPGSSRPFLLAKRPNGAARQLTNGYWIYMNYNIPALVDLIGKLMVHCGINLEEVEIAYTFKKNKRFIDSVDNLNVELQDGKVNVETIIPQKVLIILSEKYNLGFKFETTMIRLLSDEAGINIDYSLQAMLKSLMFCRKDNVYFLIDSVANAEIRHNIISTADAWVNQYGCFEFTELYKLFLDEINSNCIGDIKDFEDFFRKIYKKNIHYVSRYGTQFVCTQKNISDLLENIIKKIASEIYDDYDGAINEDELKCHYTGFSIEVLSKMINQYARTLFKMEINGIACYQTFDTLGLPDDFSMLLSDAFSQISELGLEPSLDVLNTVLSVQMGVNFRNKYSITDNQMFRRLISMYYKPEPQREWKGGIFVEVLK